MNRNIGEIKQKKLKCQTTDLIGGTILVVCISAEKPNCDDVNPSTKSPPRNESWFSKLSTGAFSTEKPNCDDVNPSTKSPPRNGSWFSKLSTRAVAGFTGGCMLFGALMVAAITA